MGPIHPVWGHVLVSLSIRSVAHYGGRRSHFSVDCHFRSAGMVPPLVLPLASWCPLDLLGIPTFRRPPKVFQILAGLARTFRFVWIFWIFIAPFGIRRGLKMIVSHRAPSSLNITPYRATWTHFRQNSIFFIHLILQLLASGTCARYIHQGFTIDSR